MNILIVDDVPLIRRLVKKPVESLGGKLFEATNGIEALNLLRENKVEISLILLDWNMPLMDGFKFLTQIKSDAQLKHIPVIMTTTENDREKIIMAIQAGASHYLVKPFTSEDLTKKILEITGVIPPANLRFSRAIREVCSSLTNTEISEQDSQLPNDLSNLIYYGHTPFYGQENGIVFIRMTKNAALYLTALQTNKAPTEVDETKLLVNLTHFFSKIISHARTISEPFADLVIPLFFTSAIEDARLVLESEKIVATTKKFQLGELEFFLTIYSA